VPTKQRLRSDSAARRHRQRHAARAAATPQPENGVLAMQRLVGNRAVTGALQAVQREDPPGGTAAATIATATATAPATTTATSAPAGAPRPTTPATSAATAAAAPTTVVELATHLNDTNVARWRSDESTGLNSQLWQILKGPFGANWFRTKAYLAQNQWPTLPAAIDREALHGPAVNLMTGMVEMRAAVFNEIKQLTLQALPRRVARAASAHPDEAAAGRLSREASQVDAGGDASNAMMEFKGSVGSDTVTSDVDVASGGSNSERGVVVFNELFRNRTGTPYDPGTVFDLNLYALDFMHGAPTVDEAAKTLTPGAAEHALGGEDAAARADDQEIWSLVHQRRYMTGPQWAAYVTSTTEGITDTAARRRKLEMFRTANERFQVFDERVQMTMADMEADFDAATERLIGSGTGDHFHHEALRLRASNRLYEQSVLEVKELRLQMALLKAQLADDAAPKAGLADRYAALAKQIASKISEGLTYANEVYSTEGSTLHVVIGMQTAAKKTAALRDAKKLGATESINAVLPKEFYKQSFNEQIGDSLKDLLHYAEQPPYAAYRAAKYIDRMCIAGAQLVPGITADAEFVALRTLANAHLAAKKSQRTAEEAAAKVRAANPNIGDDPTLVTVHDAFKGYDEAALGALRTKILSVGTKVTTAYENARSTTSTGTTTATTAPTTAPTAAAVTSAVASTAAATGTTEAPPMSPELVQGVARAAELQALVAAK